MRRVPSAVRRAAAVGAVYAVAAFLCLRLTLLRAGSLGRHWDWAIPSTADLLRAMTRAQLSAWSPVALGSYVRYRYGSTVPFLILGLPGYLGVSGAFVGKAVVYFS